jgi:fructose-1,6-bisphosphatase I
MPTGWLQLRETLDTWLESKLGSGLDPNLCGIILAVAGACHVLAKKLRTSSLFGLTGATENVNVQGEVQKPLDIIANDIFLEACHSLSSISFVVSEELDREVAISPEGPYALIFDPLDGSSNLDVNVTVGSIFSVVPGKSVADVLTCGRRQVFAGFASYGPSTSLFLTLGDQVSMFTLNGALWELVSVDIKVPHDCREFAINHSRQDLWPSAVKMYIEECISEAEGHDGARYNSRWTGSMVAEIQRILSRGGIFLYPADRETELAGGKLRLLYEANPIAFLLQAAGGYASTGQHNILDVLASSLHQRVSIFAGSSNEVQRIEKMFLANPRD